MRLYISKFLCRVQLCMHSSFILLIFTESVYFSIAIMGKYLDKKVNESFVYSLCSKHNDEIW